MTRPDTRIASGRTWPGQHTGTHVSIEPSSSGDGHVHLASNQDDASGVALGPTAARALGLALVERAALLEADAVAGVRA